MYDNPLIYGKSQIPNIVAAHVNNHYGQTGIRYYIREGDQVFHEDTDWYPYCWVSDKQIFAGLRDLTIKEFRGDLHYKHFCYTQSADTWKAMKSRIDMVEREHGPGYAYIIRNGVQSWLMGSGNTMFKGMQFNDLFRMQLDIETYGKEHFSRPELPDDQIIIAVLSSNRGHDVIIHTRKGWENYGDYQPNEKSLIARVQHYIELWDPDVLELHNGYRFDLPYFKVRAEYRGLELNWGRDGSTPWGYPMEFRAAENTYNYQTFQINGRHVIDTMFSAYTYDAVKRDMPGHGLKVVADYFGFAKDDRTYVNGDDIWWHWDNDPEKLFKYAADDGYETRMISEELNGAVFYTTPIIPMSYEDIARRGTGGKIESLFVREYLRQRHSLPLAQPARKFQGARTQIFIRGVVGPIVHADVESLYPSNQLTFNIFPKSDKLGIARGLLSNLKDLRFEWKNEMRKYEDGSPEHRKWNGQQNAAKIIINSNYGTLGDANFTFNDFDAAAAVTEKGRKILTDMVNYVKVKGGKVVEIDTDGIYFIPPKGIDTEEKEREFVSKMTDSQPEGIVIGFDGRYEKMLSLKAKNYMLLKYNGDITIKGSSFKSRGLEPVFKKFIAEGFTATLHGGIDHLRALYLELKKRIENKEIPVQDLAKTSTLSKSLSEYESDVSKKKNVRRQAQYEVGKKIAKDYGEPIGKGSRITYYISGSTKEYDDNPNFELAKSIKEYGGDENVAHYLARLDKVSEKFLPLFDGNDFRDIFMQQPSLFEVDYTAIKTVTKNVEK